MNRIIHWLSALLLLVSIDPVIAQPFIDLSGQWQYREGDNPQWSNPDLDESGWQEITVPATLRGRGKLIGMESVAWYRTQFNWPPAQALSAQGSLTRGLSLTLGQIQDADEVWLNGQKIGGEGVVTPSSKILETVI